VHRTSPESPWETSPGGLVSALMPILRENKGVWIGWAGSSETDCSPFEHDGLYNVPLHLSSKEVSDYYEGFSNSTLWPLYHDACQTPQYDRQWWAPYVAINQRFAEYAAREAAPNGHVLVQDYHLQLVPGMLRELRPDVRIGFFLHIPFPPVELFAQLPWRKRILEGMLGADVIGFQTRHGAQNFVRLVNRYTSHRGSGQAVNVDERRVLAKEYPISIDYDKIESLASDPKIIEHAKAIRSDTKGIDQRLRAVYEIFDKGNHTVDDLVLVQVSVPSRESVDEYIEVRDRIEKLVGHINGEFGTVGAVPVHYLRRSLPIEELVAYYLAADVMLVTPFRDGMNLVAKEYVASRKNEKGVLVLSEFTGSAVELDRAVLVNPHDIDGMAATIEKAITMPPQEQTRRMRSLRQRVRKRTVYTWASDFTHALEAEQPSPSSTNMQLPIDTTPSSP